MFLLKNYNKIILFKLFYIMIFLNSFTYGNGIKYELRFMKLLEHGKKDIFVPKHVENINNDISIIKEKSSTKINSFYIEVDEKDIGKKIKLKLKDEKDWIIIIPKNGEFIIPNMKKNKNIIELMDIKMIHEFSEMYFDIFGEYEYSVQIILLNSKKMALAKINSLINDIKSEKKIKKAFDFMKTTEKDIYYEATPIIPHRGYIYKVKIGHYNRMEDATRMKEYIRETYPDTLYGSFVTARLKNVP